MGNLTFNNGVRTNRVRKIEYEKSVAYQNPELATEWHPTKNGSLRPSQITVSSRKKVWWHLSYDVPEDFPFEAVRGKHFDFEWEASVRNRHYGKQGCPFLKGKKIYPGFNDLETLYPQIASQWHPTKNGSILPSDLFPNSNKKVWWLCPYDDPKTGKHFDFEWKATLNTRVGKSSGCPYLTGQKIWTGFNDLETTNPALSREWHPDKNGTLSPKDISEFSGRKVWWLYPYDDPKTGKHFDFEWEARVADRAKGEECPFLLHNGKLKVWKGFNDLATVRPELALEWHPIKNGNKTPDMYTVFSHEKVWWLCSYDDPKTGRHFDFEWEALISSRSRGRRCPYLSNEAVWNGFNDLGTKRPDLAREWSPNNSLKPHDYCSKSGKKVLWICAKGHEYKASIAQKNHRGCPYCAGKKPVLGETDLLTVEPMLCNEWNYQRNRRGPETYTRGSGVKVWWKCAKGHEWKARIANRVHLGNNCPICASVDKDS